MAAVDVRPVADRAGFAGFIEAARAGQAGNPLWVEPLREEIRQKFDLKKSPYRLDNLIQPFVAWRDGAPVGRIAAIVDSVHQAKYGDSCGFFGFIEGIDDAEVFAALFAAAEEFLRTQGMKTIRGPFNFNVNGECGLLVSGFDQPHVVDTNHAPPYYAQRVEACGYAKAMDLIALTGKVADAEPSERIPREIARAKAPTVEIENGAYLTFARDLRRFIAVYNEAWADNAYAAPIGDAEVMFLAQMMLPLVKPSWFSIATYQGEDVAIIGQIPDINEALRGLNGRLAPFGFLKLFWRVHVAGTRRSRVLLAGVRPKFRDTIVGRSAIASLMAKAVADARRAGVEEVEYSWLLETNIAAIRPLQRMLRARETRRFRLYEKAL